MFNRYLKFVGVRIALVLMLFVGVFGVIPVQATSSVVFGWAKHMGGVSYDSGVSLAVDESRNIYSTGNFTGTVDFDPGVNTYSLTSAGLYDVFISKLDTDGNFVWAKRMGGGSDDAGYSVVLDGNGNVYSTGVFRGTADFDPGADTYGLTSAGKSDIFVSKLDINGNFVWAKSIGGSSDDISNCIVLDGNGNIYSTGYFGVQLILIPEPVHTI